MPASPSPLNYMIGKGTVKFKNAIPLLSTTANLTSGSASATLAAATGLVSGTTYAITGTGIPASPLTTFLYSGSTTVTLSANATATNAAAPVVASANWQFLGNAPEFETTPAVTRKDHFSAQRGIKFKDRSVLIEKQINVRMILEEMTPANLALFYMGSIVPPGGGGYTTVNMMDLDDLSGALRLIGSNDVGDKVQVNIPTVNLSPQGALQYITDDWWKMELNGEIIGDPSTGQFGTIFHGITGEVLT